MSIVPGIVGQKAELIDGVKVDSVSELTSGAGITFNNQIIASGSMSAQLGSNTDVILTATSNRFQVVTLTAARTYTLPNAGIKAGDTFTFINRATNDSYRLYLVSSLGNAVDWIVNGKIAVMALQDAPTAAAHWATTDAVSDWVSYTPTINVGSQTIYHARYKRIFSSMFLSMAVQTSNVSATLLSVTMPSNTTSKISGGGYQSLEYCGSVVTTSGYSTTASALFYNGSNVFYFGGTNPLNATLTAAQLNGNIIGINSTVPITEWSMFN